MTEIEKKVIVTGINVEPGPFPPRLRLIRLSLGGEPPKIPQDMLLQYVAKPAPPISLTEEEFNKLGRPTVTDEVTLKLSFTGHEC